MRQHYRNSKNKSDLKRAIVSIGRFEKVLLLLVCVGLLVRVFLYFCKDDLIIFFHLSGYRRFVGWTTIGCFLAFILTIYSLVKRFWRIREKKKSLQQEQKSADTEKVSTPKACLSVSGKLDSSQIQSLLLDTASSDWTVLADPVTNIIRQLEAMDEHQNRLSRLLINNGAEALKDTQEILDKVEQYLCRNARKCLNYLEVTDHTNERDVAFIREKLEICCKDNQEKLSQIEDFLKTIVEFLNKQGEDESAASIELLSIYRKTILDSIANDF